MTRRLELKSPTRHSSDEELRRRLLAGIPVTERRLELAGVSTAVLEGGEGPPVVLMHGGIETGGIETGGVYWTPVISQLAESYRLVVPDVPGLGDQNSDDAFPLVVPTGFEPVSPP